ncbi:MAG: tripartite tricarboxylate transporter substrate binding protein [Duodenibacillus sp.]|nr:tripartite tricarboxylate transporter substrate binding protein [Duodenibacillus sp.]
MQKRVLLGGLASAGLLASLPAITIAGGYPEREIKFVIPFSPGGATDLVFRVMSEAAEAKLGKPIIPVNMGGAGGSKGSTYVHEQPADGYTLLGGHEFLLTTHLSGMVKFPWTDFEPVCTLTATPMTITASTSAPFADYKSMVAYIKAHPGQASLTISPASVGYVLFDLVARHSGFDVDKDLRIVISNGNGAQTKLLLGGNVQLNSGDLPSHLEYYRAGRVRLFGVGSEKRLPQIPDVPTFKELGMNFNYAVTRAVFAPKGTPQEIIEKVAAAYKAAADDPKVAKRIEDFGSIVDYRGPAETRAFFESQYNATKAALVKN